MTNRILAGLCLLVLGLLIGVANNRPLQPPSPAEVAALNIGAIWVVVSGLHKMGMLIEGKGFKVIGIGACAIWLVFFGILLVGNSHTGPLTPAQAVLTLFFLFGWPLVDVVGVYADK